jgi:hypothetical protein
VTEDSDDLSYEQLGETYEDILMDELECSDRVVRIIGKHLPDVSHRDMPNVCFLGSGARKRNGST